MDLRKMVIDPDAPEEEATEALKINPESYRDKELSDEEWAEFQEEYSRWHPQMVVGFSYLLNLRSSLRKGAESRLSWLESTVGRQGVNSNGIFHETPEVLLLVSSTLSLPVARRDRLYYGTFTL
jgi:hypothetical protein